MMSDDRPMKDLWPAAEFVQWGHEKGCDYRPDKCEHAADDGCMWCCERCNHDEHHCPGCGTISDHKNTPCPECVVLYELDKDVE